MDKSEGEREKRTVMFDATAIEIVESYRRGKKRIPSFSDAVNALLLEREGGSGE